MYVLIVTIFIQGIITDISVTRFDRALHCGAAKNAIPTYVRGDYGKQNKVTAHCSRIGSRPID